MTDTAEDFQPLPGADNAKLDHAFTAGPRTFQGKKLAPYGYGAEGIIDEALVGVRGDALYALVFLQVLTDLQAGFDKYGADGWNGGHATALSEDAATDAAVADVLREVHTDFATYQARANGQRAKLRRKGVDEAIKLVGKIVEEFKQTELISAEGGASAPGK